MPWDKCPGGTCPFFFCPVTILNIYRCGLIQLLAYQCCLSFYSTAPRFEILNQQ